MNSRLQWRCVTGIVLTGVKPADASSLHAIRGMATSSSQEVASRSTQSSAAAETPEEALLVNLLMGGTNSTMSPVGKRHFRVV
jgi:hypothetical protein